MSGKYDHSQPFSPNLVIIHPELMTLAQDIANEITQRPKASSKEVSSTKTLVANLIANYRKDPSLYLAYSRNNSTYSAKCIYNKSGITTDMLRRTVDGLEKNGYVTNQLGFNDRKTKIGKNSRTQPTDQLKALFDKFSDIPIRELIRDEPTEIQLKDSEKEKVPFKSSKPLEEMGKDIARWNDFMSKQHVDLAIPEENLSQWITPKENLYRTFNNSSFEEGGRHYGHWAQNMPKHLRKNLVINGKETVEIDFKSFHPRLLYAFEGIALPIDVDPYIEIEGCTRDEVKQLFQIVVNSKSPQSAQNAIQEAIRNGEIASGVDAKKALTQIEEARPKLKHYFYSGIGINLQYIDSQITAKLMCKLRDGLIPMIPVHDSYIVRRNDLHTLELLMDQSLKEVLSELGYTEYMKDWDSESQSWYEVNYKGTEFPTSVKFEGKPPAGPPIEDHIVTDDLEELLKIREHYISARKRYSLWRGH